MVWRTVITSQVSSQRMIFAQAPLLFFFFFLALPGGLWDLSPRPGIELSQALGSESVES